MKVRFGPQGIHYFDRQSGLNILLDEEIPPEDRWSRAPRYLSIALTNACELACPYCYAAKAPARLKPETVLRWSKELDSAGCFGVGFGGGEPTLYPAFVETCRAVHNETNLALTFTTHGHRFTPALTEALAGVVSFIRLSMDGIGDTYERLRGRPFAVFKAKLELVKATAPFGINFVVNKDTVAELGASADFAFSNGASELLLLPETGTDGRMAVDVEILQTLSEWARNNYARIRLATSAHAIESLDVPSLSLGSAVDSTFDFMHLDAFGTLKRSAFDQTGFRLDERASVLAGIEELRLGHIKPRINLEVRQ